MAWATGRRKTLWHFMDSLAIASSSWCWTVQEKGAVTNPEKNMGQRGWLVAAPHSSRWEVWGSFPTQQWIPEAASTPQDEFLALRRVPAHGGYVYDGAFASIIFPVCLSVAVPGDSSQVLQLPVHHRLRVWGSPQAGGIWSATILQRQVSRGLQALAVGQLGLG